jgi:hypothetical protein
MRGPIDDPPAVLLEVGDLDETPLVELPWDPPPEVLIAYVGDSARASLPLPPKPPHDNGLRP